MADYTFDTKQQRIFFTSDLHFGHENIIKYCNRPFANVDEMNNSLVDNWNSVVDDKDIVFILGDISLCCNINTLQGLVSRLKGKKYLCIGNHDDKSITKAVSKYFEDIQYQYYIDIDGQKVVLNHYPFDGFENGGSESGIQLFGHLHTEPVDSKPYVKSFNQVDVGVDNMGFKPVEFYDIVKMLIEKRIETSDKNRWAYLTLGLPGSGKTTWANEFIKFNDNSYSLSRDTFRYIAGYTSSPDDKKLLSYEKEQNVSKMIFQQIDDLTKSADGNKINLLFDDTNLELRVRRKLCSKLRKLGYNICYVIFDPESHLEECVIRRKDIIQEDIIRKMFASYKAPLIFEYDACIKVKG